VGHNYDFEHEFAVDLGFWKLQKHIDFGGRKSYKSNNEPVDKCFNRKWPDVDAEQSAIIV